MIKHLTLHELELKANEIRQDIIKMLQEAGSGHSAGPLGLADIFTEIRDLGLATGHSEEAEKLVAEMKSSIEKTVAETPKAKGLTYFHELDNELYTVTSKTFVGQIYGMFGLRNVADEAEGANSGYPRLSREYLLKQDPDLIFLADTKCCGQNAETVAKRPG